MKKTISIGAQDFGKLREKDGKDTLNDPLLLTRSVIVLQSRILSRT